MTISTTPKHWIPNINKAEAYYEKRFGDRLRSGTSLKTDEYLCFLTGWALCIVDEGTASLEEGWKLADQYWVDEIPEGSYQLIGYRACEGIDVLEKSPKVVWTAMTAYLALRNELGVVGAGDHKGDIKGEAYERVEFAYGWYQAEEYDASRDIEDCGEMFINTQNLGFERGQLAKKGERPIFDTDPGVQDD